MRFHLKIENKAKDPIKYHRNRIKTNRIRVFKTNE